ncbi:hypothetical protein C447_12090 [Halococcus hamelinensis 100A6]|uniref:Uncharacterized protein n=2 Tax=Halococcus hamelinensis TaxID=332168 RepID=M0LVV4_9EURY|nr:hypothetical protein C447_12090 [Halococcus hamelinensis 100A6]
MTESILFNFVLPFVAFQYFSTQSIPTSWALAISGVFPVIQLGLSWRRTGSVDGLSIIVLVGVVVGVVTALFSSNVNLQFDESALGTILLGIACFVSIFVGRPVLFYLSRDFDAKGDPDRIEFWNAQRQHARFNRIESLITAVWGITFVVVGIAQFALVTSFGADGNFLSSNVSSIVVAAALIIWTQWYSEHKRLFSESLAA